MATGTIAPITVTHRVDTVLAPGSTKKRRVVLPTVAPKPIHLGDMVAARWYATAAGQCRQFEGTGKVMAVTTENRRDFGTGKVYEYKRMTVIADGRRFDVLESMLQLVASAPKPQPEPAPRALMHPLPMAIMVVDVKRGKAVNTNTPPVIELPAYFGGDFAAEAQAARAAIRAEYEAEHGVVLPERVAVDVGKPKFWVRNPDGTMEKRCVS